MMDGAYLYSVIVYVGINVILAVSLNFVNGMTGQFSLGHAGFMCVGAYASALVTLAFTDPGPAHFVLALGVGAVAAAFAGFLVALPSFKLRGDYLAIATLGFSEIIRVICLNTEAIGGARGLPGIPPLANLGWVAVCVALTIALAYRVAGSREGRAYLAIRDDEIAAEAVGINLRATKTRAFVLAAALAGVAGALYAHVLRYLNPQSFDFNLSIEIVAMVVLGGSGSILGAACAALILTGLKEALRPLQALTGIDFRMAIYALLLIFLVRIRPQGLLGSMVSPRRRRAALG
jgi:branched-chain amino acid transport system permease protein